jgi:hypothetical protein
MVKTKKSPILNSYDLLSNKGFTVMEFTVQGFTVLRLWGLGFGPASDGGQILQGV